VKALASAVAATSMAAIAAMTMLWWDTWTVGLERVRQPDVAHPGPPDRQERKAAAERQPADVVQHQLGDLRHREDEHEVEKQLQVPCD
jgi:hypothetical protein